MRSLVDIIKAWESCEELENVEYESLAALLGALYERIDAMVHAGFHEFTFFNRELHSWCEYLGSEFRLDCFDDIKSILKAEYWDGNTTAEECAKLAYFYDVLIEGLNTLFLAGLKEYDLMYSRIKSLRYDLARNMDSRSGCAH